MDRKAEFATRRLLAVDADSDFCDALAALGERLGFAVTAVASGAEALAVLRRHRADLIALDLVLPDMDGLELLRQLRGITAQIPILVFSGRGPARDIAAAMRCGATDFLRKPFEAEELGVAVHKALETRALATEVEALRGHAQLEAELSMVCGDEPAMAKVRALLDQVADTNLTVLLRGESGTGKELIARALHLQSSRRGEPFVRLNCAALPSELLESELFGFERGAFTGAERRKLGKFEFADRGTIFLDEISEMPLSLQPKLLQVLQDGEFSPLGGVGDVRVDTRVVAATNVHLEAAVAEGRFRRDLFYRLNVITIRLPPLRERRAAIPLLAEHFRRRYSREYKRELPPLSEGALARLREYAWPGNIRELENLIKRAVVLGGEEALFPGDGVANAGYGGGEGQADRESGVDAGLGPRTRGPSGSGELDLTPLRSQLARGEAVDLKEEVRRAVRVAERRVIQRVLEGVRWNRKEAAKRLDVSYKALLYKMRDSGLSEGT